MIQESQAKKLVLTTSTGRMIPTFTLEEALARGMDFTDRHNLRNSGSAPREKYTPLTDECNLSSEKDIIISACEQLNNKPHVVLYTQRNGSVYATVYIPAQRKGKKVF